MKLTIDHANYKQKYQDVVTLYAGYDIGGGFDGLYLDEQCTKLAPGKLVKELIGRPVIIYKNGNHLIPIMYSVTSDDRIYVDTNDGSYISDVLFEEPSGRIQDNTFVADYNISVVGNTAVID